jgi:acyl-CoA synthetase (AMP-forming)/AMP-acid ligase II
VGGLLLADLLRGHARDRPDATALIYQGSRLTFAELDVRTNRLAQALRDADVGIGSRLAHLDQNGPECVELLFAAAKIGAVLVPLNSRLAKPELEVIFKDAGAAVLVCGVDYGDQAKSLADRVIVAGDEYEAWLSSFEAEDPGYEQASDDVAFQLYTSGTTGRPKGVLTTNGNLDGLTKVSERWSLDSDSVALVAMPLFHIGGLGWLLVAMAQGAACVLVRSIEPGALLETMVSEGVTNAFLVPTVLQMLCDVSGAEDRDWSALRSIAYGASPITTTTLKAALKTFGCPLFQVYGLTETTGAIVQLDAEDHDPDGPREHLLRAAGRPYPWMEVNIVNVETGERCAVGEVGEIRVRGSSVMPGYYQAPDETDAAFAADGWLCTGDGGYFDEDGYLFLADRVKDMIVSGGENVYPIEVEEALASHTDVAEVAVIGVADERWGEIVTAVIVAREDREIDEEELIAHTRERLAGYKLPRRIHVADELPKTATGKILKRDLREKYADSDG